MKTLLVLSALAAVAVAAPSFLAKDQKNTLPENWSDFKREKKSPQGYFYAESTPLNIDVPAVHAEAELEHSGATGRSFGLLKKSHIHSPTIIKKPSGYHLYRDSAEERAQADPSDNCSKQVKVKFCDGEKKARSVKEETHEDDVESSIKMAKEAIEHLQRDLKNIEQSPKSASWSERDVDMHEDIEVARKALDHIHRNFGNLESMSLHSTLIDEKASHLNNNGVKTNEERASQWKEHTNTFKSNVEGARNMEDIMKSADNHKSSVHIENIDTTKLMKSSEKNEHLIHEAPWKQVAGEMKATHERHATTEIKMLPDMKTSQTEVKESKVEHIHQLASEKSVETDLNLPRHKFEDKNIEHDSFQGKASDLLASEKIAATEKIDHLESHSDGKLRATEDHHHQMKLNKPGVETPLIAPATSHGLEKIQSEQHFRKTGEQEWNQQNEKHLKQPKSSLIETQSTEFSGDVLKKQFDESHLQEDKRFSHFETSMKSADHENSMKAMNLHHDIINEDKLMKPTHLASGKSADNVPAPFEAINSQMGWSMASPMTNDHLEKTTQMKAATDFNNHHTKSDMHTTMTHHHEPTMESSNRVGAKDHPFHAMSTNIHEHEHAKAADFNGSMKPDLKTSLIVDHAKSLDFNGFVPHEMPRSLMDFTGKSAMDLMQWTHKTDGGRSAYGPYGGSASGINIGGGLSGGGLSGGAGAGGAVGVFPNAHVGGCAVPLLLSCSPSVVSGSLAKSGYGSGYGSAPAYRATEELNFHNKRDAKKTKDVATKKIIKQRTNVADKKH